MADGMGVKKLSGRQLAVAVTVGGMSTAAAAAGRADWRWMLAAVPLCVLAGWLLLRSLNGRPLFQGPRGKALAALYGGWAVVWMAGTLARAGERVRDASGGQWSAPWAMVLLAIPLLWMGWGGTAAFFRAAEIFWLASALTAAAVLVLGVPWASWRYAMLPAGSWWESMLAGAAVLAAGLYALPHIYKVDPGPGERGRGLVWLTGLGLLGTALAALTSAVLSPAVAARVDQPFFIMAGLLGGGARLEGLISALWLLPDLTFIGLLSRSWGERRWPAAAVAAALALALSGAAKGWPGWVLPAGSAVLVILTGALSAGGNK